MKKLRLFFIVSLLGFSLGSCYRMPGENEFSRVPLTNNPALTCEKNNSPLPSANY